MEYEVLVLVSRDSVAVYEYSTSVGLEEVSLGGNLCREVKQEQDIQKVCEYVKDHFNIDSFSDIPMAVKIVYLGTDRRIVDELYQQFRSAASVDILSGETILPMLLTAELSVERGSRYDVALFGVDYSVTVDENDVCTVKEEEATGEKLLLEPAKLTQVYRPICKGHVEDKDDGKKALLVEKITEMFKSSQKTIQEYKEKHIALESKITELQSELNRERQINTAKWRAYEQKNQARTRIICAAPKNDSSGVNLYWRTFNSGGFGKDYFYVVYRSKKEGQNVQRGEEIYRIAAMDGTYGFTKPAKSNCHVRANATGKVFYLKADEDEIKLGTHIAIIGDKNDTREDVMEWYHHQLVKKSNAEEGL